MSNSAVPSVAPKKSVRLKVEENAAQDDFGDGGDDDRADVDDDGNIEELRKTKKVKATKSETTLKTLTSSKAQ